MATKNTRKITIKAGQSSRITVVDKNGDYVTQLFIRVPKNITVLGNENVDTYYFGEINRVKDCS